MMYCNNAIDKAFKWHCSSRISRLCVHFTECSCFWIPKTKEFLTNCSNAELTSVPDSIPPNTTHLLLNNNQFLPTQK